MRVLVFGGTGMLGHALWQECHSRFDSYSTVRGEFSEIAHHGVFEPERTLTRIRVEDPDCESRALAEAKPDVVVNCVGIVKQREAAQDPIASIEVNSLFPHRLALACRAAGCRLVHLSTDCVFSGERGNYREDDLPDPPDLYGRSKLLGEVVGPGCLTLRTSMIGRELGGQHGLLEWFLGQRGQRVKGFGRAIFSGFTTPALAGIIGDLIERQPQLEGLWHVAAEPISKLDLLTLIRDEFELDVAIEPQDTPVCDRSLNADRFREATGFVARPWPDMIAEMHQPGARRAMRAMRREEGR